MLCSHPLHVQGHVVANTRHQQLGDGNCYLIHRICNKVTGLIQKVSMHIHTLVIVVRAGSTTEGAATIKESL